MNVGKLPNHLKYFVIVTVYFWSVLLFIFFPKRFQLVEIHYAKIFDVVPKLFKNHASTTHV